MPQCRVQVQVQEIRTNALQQGGCDILSIVFLFTEPPVNALLNQHRTCRKVLYQRIRTRADTMFRIHTTCPVTHTHKLKHRKQNKTTPSFPSTCYLDPLAPAQERQCGVHRAYHEGVGDRCFCRGQFGAIRKRATDGDNH